MTEMLIKRGHRRIAALALDLADENYSRRLQGMEKALRDNRLVPDRDLVFLGSRQKRFDQRTLGVELCTECFKHENPPTAIFCVNDQLAAGAVKCLKESLNKPDVEVSGYDYISPYLSIDFGFHTLAIDFEGMGKRAMEILAGAKPCMKSLYLTPQLLPREKSL